MPYASSDNAVLIDGCNNLQNLTVLLELTEDLATLPLRQLSGNRLEGLLPPTTSWSPQYRGGRGSWICPKPSTETTAPRDSQPETHRSEEWGCWVQNRLPGPPLGSIDRIPGPLYFAGVITMLRKATWPFSVPCR